MTATQLLKSLLLLLTGMLALPVAADEVADLLSSDEAPPGVVFEIVGEEPENLGRLLSGLRADIARLRERFPGLPVAVVSHGEEQFALMESNRADDPGLHETALEMVTTEGVDLHVCGTHAGWFDVDPGEFPDYVDVSASGPAQINDYRALGYILIVLP